MGVSWIEETCGDWADGVRMLRNSLRFLGQHPSTLLPLVVIWLVSVHIIFSVLPAIPWQTLDVVPAIVLIYAINSALCLLQLTGCSILLELLQHIETGRPMRLWVALRDTVLRNLWAILPLALVWSAVEVLLWILQALLTSKDRKSTSDSVVRAWFDMAQKVLRMGTYLALPAIAWEDVGPYQAVRRAIRIGKTEIASFISATSLSALFMFFVGLPLTILAYADPDFVKAHWKPLLVYAMVIWTLKTYLEQMMMAELYLWARAKAWDAFEVAGDPLRHPQLKTRIMPSLFNGVPDLSERLGARRS